MANAWLVKPLPVGTASASSTALGDPLYVANDYAGVVWQPNVGDTAWLTLDLGGNVPLDTIMLFGLAGTFSASASVQVQLATAAQGFEFSGSNTTSGIGAGNYWGISQGLLAGSVMPISGKGVMLFTTPSSSGPPAAIRYVRLAFAGLGAGATLQVARAIIGKRIQFERNFSFGAAFGVRDLGKLDLSRRGVLLRTRGAKLRTVALTFSNARKDEVEATVKPLLEQVGNTEIVALAVDPAADAQRQNRCYCGPLVGDLSAVWRNAAAFETKLAVLSLF